MFISILVCTLFVALLDIIILFGVLPTSHNTKVKTMYIGTELIVFAILTIYDYIDIQSDISSKIQYNAVLRLSIVVCYFCITVVYIEKFHVLKHKNRALEEVHTEREQERVSILLEHQNEKRQMLEKEEFKWFAEKLMYLANKTRGLNRL